MLTCCSGQFWSSVHKKLSQFSPAAGRRKAGCLFICGRNTRAVHEWKGTGNGSGSPEPAAFQLSALHATSSCPLNTFCFHLIRSETYWEKSTGSERGGGWHMEDIPHCLLWETREWTWGSSFSERFWSWCAANTCVMWAPLSALLAGIPLSYQACAVLLNLLFILCANDPFAAIMTDLSPCCGSAVNTSKDSLQDQPASSLPIFTEAEGCKFCTLSMFKCSRACFTKSGEMQSWMLMVFPVFPLRHSCIGCSSLDAEGIHPQAAAREPRHAALHVPGQSSAHH